MFHLLRHILMTTSICTLVFIGQISYVWAQDHASESFGFKAPKPDIHGKKNVNPFNYNGNPLKFRSFLLWPNLTLEQKYNDNVLATENDTQSDLSTILNPSIIIKKELNRHEAVLSLDAEIHRFLDLSNENVENYQALFAGHFEATNDTHIPLSIHFRDGYTNRSSQRRISVNDLSISPLHVRSYEIESGITHQPNRLGLSLLGNFRRAELKNGRKNNGNILRRESNNLDRWKAIGKVSYKTPNIWEPFVELTLTRDNFTNQPAGAISRDNTLTRLLSGSSFDYRGLVFGFIGAGWENRSYTNSAIANAKGLTFDAKIHWVPQAKTQLTFYSNREQFESNEIIAGITKTENGLELQHELRRNLFLKLMGTHHIDDFDDISRKDTTYSTGIGVNYISSPRLQLGADYSFTHRNSSLSGLNLNNNILTLRAKTSW